MHRQGLFDHHRLDSLAKVAAGGTPTAQVVFGPVPEGYCWYLEGIGYAIVGNSHTAIVDVAVTPDNGDLPAQASWDHAGLVWRVGAAAISATQQFSPAVFVPPGHFVHVYAAGGTIAAGDQLTATVQLAAHQLDPHYLMSPEDRRELLAAHEHLGAELAHTAVAARRAV